MAQMMDRRRLRDIGEAHVYEVDLTDGETIRVVVSNVMRIVMGEEEAFDQQLARTLKGRNPGPAHRSFV